MNDFFRSRRDFLKSTSCGFGYLALGGLAAEQAARAATYQNPLAPRKPHFEAKAKRVIFMYMSGAPSQHDTFDYNAELEAAAGKTAGKESAGKLLPSVYKFAQHGQSGLPISELFPNVAKHADDLCLLNGMHTDSPAHPQAAVFMHTGSVTFVRPSMGSWVVYGLGTENKDLPGFITMNPAPVGGAGMYGSAFLPATFQGTRVNIAKGETPIENIRNARLSMEAQRKQIDFVQSLNKDLMQREKVDNELDGIIESYELAFRMQSSVPRLMDVAKETDSIKSLYGIDEKNTRDFGMQCLLARRMAEAGVRFIEIQHPGWDQHTGLRARLKANAGAVDKPIAGLLADLKQRDMLKDTLLVWGGEFGRSTFGQSDDGRRHNNTGYTMWLAGGGIKGGMRHGSCDVNGTAVENKVHLHDLNATILNQLGLDHKRLTYRYGGRDFRLTDVHGEVVRSILA